MKLIISICSFLTFFASASLSKIAGKYPNENKNIAKMDILCGFNCSNIYLKYFIIFIIFPGIEIQATLFLDLWYIHISCQKMRSMKMGNIR